MTPSAPPTAPKRRPTAWGSTRRSPAPARCWPANWTRWQGAQEAGAPLAAIVAGSKVSTKLTLLENLADKVDQLIVGGGIANTFLLAAGKKIGKSLAEPDLLDAARRVMAKTKVPLPQDVVCAKEFSANANATVKPVDAVEDDDMILDIGPQAAAELAEIIVQIGHHRLERPGRRIRIRRLRTRHRNGGARHRRIQAYFSSPAVAIRWPPSTSTASRIR
jgi:hypothetical protein